MMMAVSRHSRKQMKNTALIRLVRYIVPFDIPGTANTSVVIIIRVVVSLPLYEHRGWREGLRDRRKLIDNGKGG